jgi:hypothetical protein
MQRSISIFFCWIWLANLACNISDSQASEQPSSPDRRMVQEAFRKQGKILVVYADNDSVYAALYRDWWQQKARSTQYLQIESRAASKVSEAELRANPVFFVGSIQNLAIFHDWLPFLPIQLSDSGFTFQEDAYHSPDHTLSFAFYPHPFASPLPVGCLIGNSERLFLLI